MRFKCGRITNLNDNFGEIFNCISFLHIIVIVFLIPLPTIETYVSFNLLIFVFNTYARAQSYAVVKQRARIVLKQKWYSRSIFVVIVYNLLAFSFVLHYIDRMQASRK